MRKLIAAIALFLMIFTVACARAADVPFSWDYPTEPPTTPAGFEMRLSNAAGGAAVVTQDCPGTSIRRCTVPGVAKGSWFATVRAYVVDALGKRPGPASNEVEFLLAGDPLTPINLSLKK